MGTGQHRCTYGARTTATEADRRRRPGTATLLLHGEIDLAATGEVRARFDDAARTGATRVRADLSGVAFIDCAGLGLLMSCLRHLRGAGVEVTVAGRSPAVERLVRLTGAALG